MNEHANPATLSAQADELEERMMNELGERIATKSVLFGLADGKVEMQSGPALRAANPDKYFLMGADPRLPAMPKKPTLIDFFNNRFASLNHLLQSATHALKGGHSEKVILACLLHDIGYVRGICQGDSPGLYLTGQGANATTLPPGATDASLQPWHVDRGIRFVRERFATSPWLDVEVLASHIAYTRFPVPDDPAFQETRTLRGLVRAADLIGQLADPYYLRKLPALFQEFRETGMDESYGFAHADAMREGFPRFYEGSVRPSIAYAIELLRTTAAGRQWVASLHAHVYEAATLQR